MKTKPRKGVSKPYPNPDDFPISMVEETMVHYQTMYVDPVALLNSSKKGLRAKAALDFISISGFTYDEFQETFKTTVKTIQNYAVQDLKLDAALSEKILKSFALFKKGIEVFGSAKAFHQWLNTAAYGLGNQLPFNLMDTVTGITLIEEELVRIGYGDLA
ncbi:MAG: antitoxin Xre/MbcA/ParS toxin-binding domain-containing protein [Bacteroidota bacterium]